jgi:hypothetical protein
MIGERQVGGGSYRLTSGLRAGPRPDDVNGRTTRRSDQERRGALDREVTSMLRLVSGDGGHRDSRYGNAAVERG